MDDLIKRQDAIGKIKDWMKFLGYSHGERNVMECTIQMLEELPSAESEIIRCKDCKWCREHYDTDGNAPYWICVNWDSGTDADGFCYEAERRADERLDKQTVRTPQSV